MICIKASGRKSRIEIWLLKYTLNKLFFCIDKRAQYKQPPLLLRKLDFISHPVQLAEINAKRKVQQQEQKLHTDIVPIGTQHPFGKTICTHVIVCRENAGERSNAFRQQFLIQKNPRNKGKR